MIEVRIIQFFKYILINASVIHRLETYNSVSAAFYFLHFL